MFRWLISLWLRFLNPIWCFFPAWIESWFHDKRKGKDIFGLLRSQAPNVSSMSNFMKAQGFKWTSDPLGGALDYYSFAWVTCEKGEGDCDDWATLWLRLLRHHGKVERMVTRKKSGGFHMMCIFTNSVGMCHLLSNLNVRLVVPEYEKNRLLNSFYGDDTDFSIIY